MLTVSFPPVSLFLPLTSLYAPFISSLFLPPLILTYHSHFADAPSPTSLERAKEKLLDGKFPYGDLPTETSSPSWDKISEACKLTLPETVALQNAVATGTKPAFYPRY